MYEVAENTRYFTRQLKTPQGTYRPTTRALETSQGLELGGWTQGGLGRGELGSEGWSWRRGGVREVGVGGMELGSGGLELGDWGRGGGWSQGGLGGWGREVGVEVGVGGLGSGSWGRGVVVASKLP